MSDRERRRGGILGMVALGLILAAVTVVGLVAWKPELLLREQRLAVTIEPRDVVAAGAAWKISGAWMRTDTSTVDEAARKRSRSLARCRAGLRPREWMWPKAETSRPCAGFIPARSWPKKPFCVCMVPTPSARLWARIWPSGICAGSEPKACGFWSEPIRPRRSSKVFSVSQRALRVEIKALGSSTGFKDLLGGTCDAAMSSRRIKDSERAALAHLGDMTSVDSEYRGRSPWTASPSSSIEESSGQPDPASDRRYLRRSDLGISPVTVKHHIQQALHRLSVNNRAAAAPNRIENKDFHGTSGI